MNKNNNYVKTALLIAVTAAVYYLLTQVGIYYKLPYEQGTLIWPAAGFSFVMVLIFGFRVIPGIFIGALLGGFDYLFGLSLSLNEIISKLFENTTPFYLGLGASLQAGVGAWLVKSYRLYPQKFYEPSKIIRFYFYSAVVGGFISSFIGNLAFGFGFSVEFIFAYLVWWVGDAISVCVFATMLVAATRFRIRRGAFVFSFLLVGLGIVITIYNLTLAWDNDRLDHLLEMKINEFKGDIADQFDEYNTLMVAMQGFVRTQNSITKEEFHIFTEQFLPMNPTVQAVNISEVVSKDELNEFKSLLEMEYNEDINLIDRDGSPLKNQDQYSIIKYVEPFEPFSNLVGRDMSSSFATNNAMDYAVKYNTSALTMPLISPINPERALIAMYYPIVSDGEVAGFSAMVIELSKFMRILSEQQYADGINFKVLDYGDDTDFSLLFQNATDEEFGITEHHVSIPVFNRTWDISVTRDNDFNMNNMSNQPMYVGLVSAILLGLFIVWVVFMTGQGSYLEKLVRERTNDLKHANEAKSSFMANMSHDLRTPLNAIIGFSELMRNELFGPVKNERYAAYIDDIHHSSSYLLSLINDLLDYSTLEAGKRKLAIDEIIAEDVINECLRTLHPLSEGKNLKMEITAVKKEKAFQVDEKAFRQVIINILSNAIKYTGDNGSIKIDIFEKDGANMISIEDTGEGIPAENIKVILEPFGRSISNPHLAQEGTGLGLSIVHSLMQLHDGSLFISSEVGVGTKVTLQFPMRTIDA
ncbi:ATP-binding protein [Pseudemcibacter aquimaris]|uniref:ATP-binding protein n=1 Tax=Pseudemcibacter aquimaris TaxID=2857064 RepID=UPI0020121960|nr:ATP-binding protein [Pseudemcibacter aquimaris]MCC3859845.1 CHASE domain-containing protein [Pseudemcibacter aquimaris]WDU57177.1 CHASE domain-containing protein [Pseudemcibacter aquimaris]